MACKFANANMNVWKLFLHTFVAVTTKPYSSFVCHEVIIPSNNIQEVADELTASRCRWDRVVTPYPKNTLHACYLSIGKFFYSLMWLR